MKLDFEDNLSKESIELWLTINDGKEREIFPQKCNIKWSLNLQVSSWGIDGFDYALRELLMPIQIDEICEDRVKSNTFNLSIIFNSSPRQNKYICRIYEDVLEGEKWIEEELCQFPIDILVEESPETNSGNRSQIYVKYVEIDLQNESRKVTLSI